ncbi:serglycin-like [Anoplopoma fimbria]|uniref:serglycin-like n=1 Tax=Anoplopoma fimbria TaxID=229290 RepID=UPI0023EAC02C|nr:serglycin-like [Anoplopoma fimbria]
MKLFLFFVITCFALHNSKGAPSTAEYKFVKCNPEGDKANCVTQKSPIMAWTPDLPAKLPALTAQYLEAEPEDDESQPREEAVESEMDEEENQMESEEGESPPETEDGSGGGGYEGSGVYEGSGAYEGSGGSEGSGGYEGSAGVFMADRAFGETGSGESWAEKDDGDMRAMRRLFPSWSYASEAKPAEQEMKEDHFLQL